MARIRTIKPEFWSDEKLSECSLSARLLFMGLISFADDEGRLEYSPVRIRMQVFPCGSVKASTLNDWLGELRERSLIRIYTVDGKQFLDIPGFTKHQKINRPTASRLPPFSLSPHEPLNDGSVTPPSGREGNGKEGKGSREEVAASPLAAVGLDLESWKRWEAYRHGIRKPIRDVSREAAMRDMAKFGSQQAEAVEHTIAKGWTGLRLPDLPRGTAPPRREAKTADQLEAEERARGAA